MSCKECEYFDCSEDTISFHDLITGCGVCKYSIPIEQIPSSFHGGGLLTEIDRTTLKINGYMNGCNGIDCPAFKPIKSL